ncbi:hypothetical protein B0H34DRAFT_783651 [Crassisporium funariophilum]|nr:hypothetical protein B0H34DRAFT_783651 [Crassisporium funariophilum]
MSQPVTTHLKARIPVLYYQQNLGVKEICSLLGVKNSLVYKTLAYITAYGVSYNPHACPRGRHRILLREDIKFILSLVEHQHCIYLDKIQEELFSLHGCWPSIPTLVHTLRHLDFSRKCISAHALERDDIKCAAYMNTIADTVLHPDMLMPKGWALVGRRCGQRRFFVRGK